MRRRTVLKSGVAIGLGLLAGCAETQTTATGTGDESGLTPTETTQTTTSTSDSSATTETTTTGADGSGTDTSRSGPEFGALFTVTDNYAVDGVFTDPESGTSGRMTSRYHDGDYYQRIELDSTGESFETYVIDDDTYLVFGAETCILNPGASMQPDASVDGEAQAYGDEPSPEIRPTGTTQIEGEEVYVFEMTDEDVADPLTLYVSTSTGYLRRVETATVRFDYYDWGEVNPISPPEIDCQTQPN